MALKNYLTNLSNGASLNDGTFKDLGFGTKDFEKTRRLINRDGSFNINKKGRRFFRMYDAYHTLITVSWTSFFMMVGLGYLVANILFAILYYLIGIDQLSGVVSNNMAGQLSDAFFFSTQTIATLGYGTISPVGFWMSFAAAVESLLGLLGFALITGLLYGRFSRPYVRVVFSDHAVIAPYRDLRAFEFRIANERNNLFIEVEVQVVYTQYDREQQRRVFHDLPLERDKVNFMSLSWTIVHPIDADSPLFGMSQEAFYEADGEFLILIKGFDDTFSQTIYTRSSYKNHETHWGKKYEMMFEENEAGYVDLHLNKIGTFRDAPLDETATLEEESELD